MGVGIPKISCLHHYEWDSLKKWAGFPLLAAEPGPPVSPAQHQGCCTVSNPAATRGLAQGPQGRREAAAGEYPSLSLSGKQSNRRTCCTAVLPSKAAGGGEGRHGGSPVQVDGVQRV